MARQVRRYDMFVLLFNVGNRSVKCRRAAKLYRTIFVSGNFDLFRGRLGSITVDPTPFIG